MRSASAAQLRSCGHYHTVLFIIYLLTPHFAKQNYSHPFVIPAHSFYKWHKVLQLCSSSLMREAAMIMVYKAGL